MGIDHVVKKLAASESVVNATRQGESITVVLEEEPLDGRKFLSRHGLTIVAARGSSYRCECCGTMYNVNMIADKPASTGRSRASEGRDSGRLEALHYSGRHGLQITI